MNTDLIQQAHKSLIIQNIFLHSGEINTKDDFCPLDPKSYEIQFKQSVKDSRRLKLDDEDNKSIELILFHYIAGFRALPAGLSNEIKNSEDVSEKVEVEVVATFSAIYRMVEKINEEAITEFAKYNVGFNVWPYWREYASSTAIRLGLSSFAIPLYRLPENIHNLQ